MIHYSPVPTVGSAADVTNIRAFLQQAVNHYPRLVAFCITLALPHRAIPSHYRALILRFYTEVWQRIGEYSWQRQQARRSSPPTLLRWIWASTSAPECRVVLLMNLDTLGAVRDEGALRDISEIIRKAWLTVTGTDRNGVTNIMPIILNRSGRGTFTTPFNQLSAQVKSMVEPLATARTGVTG